MNYTSSAQIQQNIFLKNIQMAFALNVQICFLKVHLSTSKPNLNGLCLLLPLESRNLAKRAQIANFPIFPSSSRMKSIAGASSYLGYQLWLAQRRLSFFGRHLSPTARRRYLFWKARNATNTRKKYMLPRKMWHFCIIDTLTWREIRQFTELLLLLEFLPFKKSLKYIHPQTY